MIRASETLPRCSLVRLEAILVSTAPIAKRAESDSHTLTLRNGFGDQRDVINAHTKGKVQSHPLNDRTSNISEDRTPGSNRRATAAMAVISTVPAGANGAITGRHRASPEKQITFDGGVKE